MRQTHARSTATLLWLKARYDQLTNQRYGRETFLVCLVLFGTFFLAQPADACGITDITGCILTAFIWITGLIAALLAKLIAIVLEYLIPVMLYNNFTTAPVVTAGWALVRDTVNMFFVIVLIVIAFGTIFGHKKFQWQTQVPRLLLFAIVINFSKTLAGVMIDFGQVVMLTFANALRDIGTGNLIEMFGLNKVSSFSATSDSFSVTKGSGASGWDLLLASLAAVFILAWVLVIMLLLFVILLYRIVGLWVLIVTAPLAWFAGGAQILGSKAYDDWWEQFKCLVAIGPIVTFFLWLALAVAGAGSSAEGFESATAGNSASFLTTIFEFQHFMSLVVGSALLLAGMQTAQNFCSTMKGGFLGKQLGKAAAFGPGFAQFGKGLAFKGVGKAARAVGSGVRGAGRGIGRLTTPLAEKAPLLKYATHRGRAEVLGRIAQKAGPGFVGKTLGRYTQRRQAVQLGARHAEIARAGEKYKSDTIDQKANQLNRFAKTGGSKLFGGNLEAKALFKDMLNNKDLQKKFEESGGDIGSLWKRYGAQMETDFQGDRGTLDKLGAFKKRHAHVTGSASELKDKDDLDNLSLAAMNDSNIQQRMKNMKVQVRQGKKGLVELDGMSAAISGHFGEEKQKIAQGQIGNMDASTLSQLDTGTLLKFASLPKIDQVANVALENKNVQQVQQIISGLIDKHDDVKTSPTDRDGIAGIINGLYQNLNNTIDKKDGTPRFLAQAGTLQSMIKRDFPVPPTEKEIQKKETEKVQIKIEITKKEKQLESEIDVGKRIKLNDEIASLQEKMGFDEGKKDSGSHVPVSDSSAIIAQLSTMNSALMDISSALAVSAATEQTSAQTVNAVLSDEVLTHISEQLEKMASQAQQHAEFNKPEVKTGFFALKQQFNELMHKSEQIVPSVSGEAGGSVSGQQVDVAAIRQALDKFREKLTEQQSVITEAIAKQRSSGRTEKT